MSFEVFKKIKSCSVCKFCFTKEVKPGYLFIFSCTWYITVKVRVQHLSNNFAKLFAFLYKYRYFQIYFKFTIKKIQMSANEIDNFFVQTLSQSCKRKVLGTGL
jgi:hypothetical protein